MNLSEEFQRVESGDLSVSQRFVQRLKSSLNATRDPELLGDIVDYYLQRGSVIALRVLTSLKDIYSQVGKRNEVGDAVNIPFNPVMCLYAGFFCKAP